MAKNNKNNSNSDSNKNITTLDIKFKNSYEMSGRRKIKIPVSFEDFIKDPVKNITEYLHDVLEAHKKNVSEIEYLKMYSNGIQNILEKTRADHSNINNVEVTNYAFEFVEFKKGFTVGKPIKYIYKGEDENNEMELLNQYLTSVNKKSLDLSKYDDIYTSGVAYTYTISQRKNWESDESPFVYKVLDNTKTFVVYSDDVFSNVLFSGIITYTLDENSKRRETYTIYYNYKVIVLREGTREYKNSNDKYIYIPGTDNPPLRYSSQYYYEIIKPEESINIENPITEYFLSDRRMGCFEMVLSQLNSLNTIRSNQLDDIEQVVNTFLVFMNQRVDEIKKNMESFREMRALVLYSNDPSRPADVKTIQLSLDQADINDFYNDEKENVFSIVGVPLPISNTGQGVSGEAQTYGGGWENAQSIASVQTNYISQFEREDLRKIIRLCKKDVNSGIKKLNINNISIKYTINKSNNVLVKTQSCKYLLDSNFPPEIALELSDLSDDSYLIGKQVEEYRKEKAQEEKEEQEEIEIKNENY